MTGVSSSGSRIMSDSLIAFHPAIDEPSNMKPSSMLSLVTALAGNVVCCSLPRGSVNRKSTHLTSLSLIIFRVFSDMDYRS